MRSRDFVIAVAIAALILTFGTVDARAQAPWARTHGGTGGGEFVHAAREMPNGDIVIAASTDSFGTMTGDGWLIRLDASGNVVSQSCAGSPVAGGVDGAVVLDDGGAVFSSRDVFDPFLLHQALITRVNPDGSVAWSTRIASDPGRYFVNDLVVAADGGIVGVGQASDSDAGPHLGWIVKLDAADGTLAWQQYWGGVIGQDVSFDAAVLTEDQGFAITGWTTGGAGAMDLLVAKATATGSISWTQAVGGDQDDKGEAIAEIRGGGGYAVAGYTNSFTASGHGAWIVRLDAAGTVTWTTAVGDGDWLDLQAIAQASDQELVVLGRLGVATNDLWAAKVGQGTATIAWQRRYEGDSGDYGAEILELTGGDLLLAGTWAWGFPEEDLWMLRTASDGLMAGCALVHDTALTTSAPRFTRSMLLLPPFPPLGSASAATVVTSPSALSTVTQCAAPACPLLTCDAILVDPEPACEGASRTITAIIGGGTPPFTFEWDLDGDASPDAFGNPLVTTLPPGTTGIILSVKDSCVPVAQDCSLRMAVSELPSAPPGEVSDVRGGAVPLLVSDHGDTISFEDRADAVAYSLYADAIGSWYAPGAPSGSACFVTTTPGGAGRLETSPALAMNTWVVVTASSPCAEGSAGRDSFDAPRMSTGTWSPCGPAP